MTRKGKVYKDTFEAWKADALFHAKRAADLELELSVAKGDLRDTFAAAALTGIIACYKDHAGCETREARAKLAFEYADLAMKARGK